MQILEFIFPYKTVEWWVVLTVIMIAVFGFVYCVYTGQIKLRDGLAGLVFAAFIVYIAGRMMGLFRWYP